MQQSPIVPAPAPAAPKPTGGTSQRFSLHWVALIVSGLVGLALILATAVYTAARILSDHSAISIFITLGLLALIALFVAALYFSEGCEIAATTLLDRDEDELDLGNTVRVLGDLRDNIQEFVSGRQLIVLILVIGFAAFCEAFATNAPHAQMLATDWRTSWLFDDVAINIYAFVFPILTALWLSQLLSKFIATRRPATFFRSPFAQIIVRFGIWIGRTLRVGDVSVVLSEQVLKNRPDDARTASRKKLYSALAAFKDGFGFETVRVDLTIDHADGSLSVKQHIFVRAYAALRGKLIRQDDFWSGEIIDPKLFVNSRGNVAVVGPATKVDSAGEWNLRWDFTLENPLKMGETFDFVVEYDVGKGGTKAGTDVVDCFYYVQEKYPVRDLQFFIRLKDTSTHMLTAGEIVAVVSDDPDINARESARFSNCTSGAGGGLSGMVQYPLMGGTYKMKWKVARKLLPDGKIQAPKQVAVLNQSATIATTDGAGPDSLAAAPVQAPVI